MKYEILPHKTKTLHWSDSILQFISISACNQQNFSTDAKHRRRFKLLRDTKQQCLDHYYYIIVLKLGVRNALPVNQILDSAMGIFLPRLATLCWRNQVLDRFTLSDTKERLRLSLACNIHAPFLTFTFRTSTLFRIITFFTTFVCFPFYYATQRVHIFCYTQSVVISRL